MKNDNQHLDFLISQYVDGCLEGANKKSVEQKLLTDPAARKLYTEHREAQDLLDDWGNRIPLIHWDEFDKKLATRLEHEVVGGERGSIFRRWMKPVAAAAALFVAAALGYAWHGWSQTPGVAVEQGGAKVAANRPHMSVEFPEMARGTQPSRFSLKVDEPNAQATAMAGRARVETTISRAADAEAALSLRENVAYGKQDVKENTPANNISPSAIAVGELTTQPAADNKSNDTAFPQ